jgi:type I restriction enzyme R subunit
MPYESEKITRKLRIDKQLQSAGWNVIPYSSGMDLSVLSNHAVEELPIDNGPADYTLFVNGVLLGVV